MSTDTSVMTVEEFLALPDDGEERWLIDGQLREKDEPTTYRNRFHSWVEAKIVFVLKSWLQEQPEPMGAIHSGEVGCRLSAETVVGIDVAYFSAETIARQTDETSLIDGAPVLAVEVLSPSDKHEDITEKVAVYLRAGVQAVWIVDPYFQTVQVHRAGLASRTFNIEQTLPGEDVLPGLELPVVGLFPPQSD